LGSLRSIVTGAIHETWLMVVAAVVHMLDVREIVTVLVRSIETGAILEAQLVVVAVAAAVDMLDVRSIETGAICETWFEAECESAWEDNTRCKADLGAHSI
jgi:hypothetical protein